MLGKGLGGIKDGGRISFLHRSLILPLLCCGYKVQGMWKSWTWTYYQAISQLSIFLLGQLVRSPPALPMNKVLSGSALPLHSLSIAFVFPAQGPRKSMKPFYYMVPFGPSASWATVLSQLPLSCGLMDNGLSQSFLFLPHQWETGWQNHVHF